MVPYKMEGTKYFSLARMILYLASLFPGLVNFIVSFVVISRDCSSKENFKFYLSLSMQTGTDFATRVMSKECCSLMTYFTTE